MDKKRRAEIEDMRSTDGMWVAGWFRVSKAVGDLLAEIDALTPDAKLGRAVREGLLKAAGHSSVTISVCRDAPHSWAAENSKGQQKTFDDPDEVVRWLGAWDD